MNFFKKQSLTVAHLGVHTCILMILIYKGGCVLKFKAGFHFPRLTEPRECTLNALFTNSLVSLRYYQTSSSDTRVAAEASVQFVLWGGNAQWSTLTAAQTLQLLLLN